MYTTIEANLDHGHIIPVEPGKLPELGRVLVTILEPLSSRPDWKKIKKHLGTLKTEIDATKWQRQVRDEWDHRS